MPKEVRPLTKQDEFTMTLFENLIEQVAETNRLLGELLKLNKPPEQPEVSTPTISKGVNKRATKGHD